MKKIQLLLFLLSGSYSLVCQTPVALTFIGKDSITQQIIPIDSLYVKNLIENCDTVLYGPVPELVMMASWPVGINGGPVKELFLLKQNYPNPFNGHTCVNILREYRGPVNLVLFDELGRQLAEYHNDLEQGSHSFEITASGNRVLTLALSDERNYRVN